MRWVTLLLLTALLLICQSTLAPRFEFWGGRPDWLLVVVVFLAMNGRMPDAAVGAWLIGAGADLMTIERIGLMSLSYLVVAMFVASMRDFLFRSSWITQFVVTLLVCFLLQILWLIYRQVLYAPRVSLWMDLWVHGLWASVYTAAWAPLMHRALRPLSRLLGLGRSGVRSAVAEKSPDWED